MLNLCSIYVKHYSLKIPFFPTYITKSWALAVFLVPLQSSTQLIIHLKMYINTLNSFLLQFTTLVNTYILTKLSPLSLPQIQPNLTILWKCTFYINFINCADNVYLLCWPCAHIAFVFQLWSILCWCNRLNCSVASGKFPKNSVTLRFFKNSCISNIFTNDHIIYHSAVSVHIT